MSEILLMGWNGSEWIKLQCDTNGLVKVDLSEVKLDDLATPDDNTDLNATNARHGLLLKLIDDVTKFLRSDGAWAVPPGNGNGAAVIWKDVSEQAYFATQPSAFDWTDLDLTAYTSADAKLAILEIGFHVENSGTGGEHNINVRKNGTTPTYFPSLKFYNTEANGSLRYMIVIVGMDSEQVIEYKLSKSTGGSMHTASINVLGYIE